MRCFDIHGLVTCGYLSGSMLNRKGALSRTTVRAIPGGAGLTIALMLACLMSIGRQRQAAAQESPYLTGKLLAATPEMPDPRFVQTVIYIVRHDKSGAMGLIVNRPIAKGPISDLLKSLGAESEGAQGEITLHYGGPVQPGKGFILHSDDYVLEGTEVLQNGLALTGDIELLRLISLDQGPRRSLFVLGYAGWGPGQLEDEIKANAWFSIPADQELIFGQDAQVKWDRAMDRRKIEL